MLLDHLRFLQYGLSLLNWEDGRGVDAGFDLFKVASELLTVVFEFSDFIFQDDFILALDVDLLIVLQET